MHARRASPGRSSSGCVRSAAFDLARATSRTKARAPIPFRMQEHEILQRLERLRPRGTRPSPSQIRSPTFSCCSSGTDPIGAVNVETEDVLQLGCSCTGRRAPAPSGRATARRRRRSRDCDGARGGERSGWQQLVPGSRRRASSCSPPTDAVAAKHDGCADSEGGNRIVDAPGRSAHARVLTVASKLARRRARLARARAGPGRGGTADTRPHQRRVREHAQRPSGSSRSRSRRSRADSGP